MSPVTAVTFFHRSGDPDVFGRWALDLLAMAQSVKGHESGRVSVRDDPRLDWAVAVTFSDSNQLHGWLDSSAREAVLRDGQQRGFWRSSVDLIFTDAGPMTAGVGLFRHSVLPGKEDEFRDLQHRLAAAAVQLPGYECTVLLPADQHGEWISMVRFRTGQQLTGWMRSSERAAALAGMRSTLREDFATVSNTTPFGTTVRIDDGRVRMTPNWKSAMVVLLVLYPTVMLLSRFLGPALDRTGAEPWLTLWLSQIVSIAAMQWWLMPAVSRRFRNWLDPVDGSGTRTSIVGAVVIVALYALTLMLFATVRELHFWDYAD